MNESELVWLAPSMKAALPIVRQVFKQYAPPGFNLEFMTGKEWFHHGMFSLHRSGNADDLRTKTLPDHGIGALSTQIATVLQQGLDAQLGPGTYKVLRNDQGPLKPHIHAQYNKGGRWSEPGNFGTGASRMA